MVPTAGGLSVNAPNRRKVGLQSLECQAIYIKSPAEILIQPTQKYGMLSALFPSALNADGFTGLRESPLDEARTNGLLWLWNEGENYGGNSV
jgi:hypothetical protein